MVEPLPTMWERAADWERCRKGSSDDDERRR
jgi:hypothetical protein